MKSVIIKSETGLHARPASLIVQKCSDFKSEIFLIKDGNKINARSIMNILAMAIMYKDEISVEAIGEDAEQAENALVEILESGE